MYSSGVRQLSLSLSLSLSLASPSPALHTLSQSDSVFSQQCCTAFRYTLSSIAVLSITTWSMPSMRNGLRITGLETLDLSAAGHCRPLHIQCSHCFRDENWRYATPPCRGSDHTCQTEPRHSTSTAPCQLPVSCSDPQ